MNDFIPLNNKDINPKLLSLLYVKVNAVTCVPITELKIEQTEKTLLEFYEKNKSQKDFFFLKKDQISDFLIKNQTLIKETPSPKAAAQILDQCLDYSFNNIVEENFNPSSINLGISLIYNTTNNRSPEFLKELFSSLENDQAVAKETFVRSLFCFGIMKSKNYQSAKTYNDIITASLLCDVGNVVLPGEPHPQNSCIVLEKNGVKDSIIEIVRHHHENFNGSGPLKLVKDRINPLAKVIRLGEEIMKQGNNPVDSLNKIIESKEFLVDKDLAESFRSMLLKVK